MPEKIRATTGGIVFLLHPFRFSDTSVNNPSIVGSASHCNRSSPLHKGAKGDGALPTLPKPHFPSKSTISLPPLSKVRCCRPKEFGRLPEGLPQLHRPSPSPQPSQKDNNPSLSIMSSPPLSKGGGLTARHKLSLCCIFACDTSAFFIRQTFCRQDGGIVLCPPTSPSPQPSQKHYRLSPRTNPSTTSPLNFSLFPIQYSFPPCIPLTTSADNSIIKAVTSISI